MNKYSFRKNAGEISTQDLIREVSKYQVVSFDIFDTLLKRNVKKPTDVFKIVENVATGNSLIYKDFYDRRIDAEKRARETSNNEEVTLEEIYNSYDKLEGESIDYLIGLEKQVESQILTKNLDVYPVFQQCIRDQKRVFIISDMYLAKDFIESILRDNGICGYEKIYVSSDLRLTKRTGKLFDFYLRENQIQPTNACHIGDAFLGDVEVPEKLGIHSIHIYKNNIRDKRVVNYHDTSLNQNSLFAFINNNIDKTKNDYFQFGYDTFGPFLWGFVKWIHDQAKRIGLDRIYFFSRDGLIMKQAFDICFMDEDIKTFYLEVSRRSLRLPVLSLNPSFSNLLSTITVAKIIPIKAIFDAVGLDIIRYKELLQKYGFDESSQFEKSSIKENKELKALYEELLTEIIPNAQREYENMVCYIQQHELEGKFGVVDIGWSGGMQRYLEQVMTEIGIEHDVFGFYMGITESYKRNMAILPELKIQGYLFDCANNPGDYDKRSSFVGLFESLCLERAGSVKNYYIDDNGVANAKRYEYEYQKDGAPTKECLEIKDVQEGALKFVEDIALSAIHNSFAFSADELFYMLRNAGANPDKHTITLFSEFDFYDEGSTIKLASPQSFLFYVIHPKQLKKDFLQSKWKTGFMKKLLRINLPYEKVFYALYKLK